MDWESKKRSLWWASSEEWSTTLTALIVADPFEVRLSEDLFAFSSAQ
jgi:hypothetical protein